MAAVHPNAGLEILSVKAVLHITAPVDIGNIMNIALMVAIPPREDAKAVQVVEVAEVLLNAPLEIINVPVPLPIIVLAVIGSMTNIVQTVVIHQLEDVKVIPAAAVQKSVLLENINVRAMHLINVPVDIGNIMNIVPTDASLQQANVKVLQKQNAQ